MWNPFKKTTVERKDDLQGYGPSGGGWTNNATGLGTFARDKVMQGMFLDSIRISDAELLALYHGDDLASKIVEFRPREMFRKGYYLQIPDPSESSQSDYAQTALSLEKYAASLHMNERFLEAMIFGRLLGGCVLIVGADDGLAIDKPLNRKNIRSIKYLNLVDRRFLYALTYYGDALKPNYGEPETYQLTSPLGQESPSVIHESRLIRFDGAPVDIIKRRNLAGWTLSVLQRPYNVMRQFQTAYQAMGNLMSDAAQGVFKIKGLIDSISSGDVQTLQDRMAVVDMFRSASKSLLLDTDGEDFTRIPTPFTGIPELLELFMQRMASSVDIPTNLLFDRPNTGLNNTGEATFRAWYDTVSSAQKNELRPVLIRMFELICLAKDSPTKGKIPESGLEIYFNSLWAPTETEQADVYGKMATADSTYIASGVLTPSEVALSRFRGTDFKLNTEIDVASRKKVQYTEIEEPLQPTPNTPDEPTAIYGLPGPSASK